MFHKRGRTSLVMLILLFVSLSHAPGAHAQNTRDYPSYGYDLPAVPDIDGGCVPVDPMTGAPCPECCGNQGNDDEDDELDDGGLDDYVPDDDMLDDSPEEECIPPPIRNCLEECTVLQQEKNQCVFPEWRNCRQECAGLPSYPTYEFEACLGQCDNYNLQDRVDYDNCVAQGTPSYHDLDEDCFNQCNAQYSQAAVEYDECVMEQDNQKDDDQDDDSVDDMGAIEVADDTVDIDATTTEIEGQFMKINEIFRQIAGRNAIITSGYREQKPGHTFSYHQTGDAVDIRIKDISTDDGIKIFDRLQSELPNEFDVCLEVPDPTKLPSSVSGCIIKNSQPHIHVEYDRNRVEAGKPGRKNKFPEPPPPIVTNYELPGEQQEINNPGLLKELKDAFQGREILFDETLYLPEGLDARVSTSAKDVAVWGAQVVGQEAALKVAAYALPKETLDILKNDFEILSQGQSVYEISQVEPKISGDYAVGPFTVEIRYLPELIPEAYTEDDVGLFHVVVTEGKLTLSRVKNVFVDKVNNKIFGRVDGFSFYVVAIIPGETQDGSATGDSIGAGEASGFLGYLSFFIFFGIIVSIIIFFIAYLSKKKGKNDKTADKKTIKTIKTVDKEIKEIAHKNHEKNKEAETDQHGTGWGVASLVLSIVGLMFLPVFGMLLGILAIIFSRKQHAHNPTGAATAGLIIGVISIVLNIMFFIVLGIIVAIS